MATIRRMETGYFIADNAIFNRGDLTCQEKLVYLNLCRRADSGSTSFPSYQRIADDCSVSRRSAIRAIDALQAKGVLLKQMRKRQEGDYTSNEYVILPPVTEATRISPNRSETENTTIPDETRGSDTQSPPEKKGVVTHSHHPKQGGSSDTQSPGSDTVSPGWCQRVTRVVTQCHPKDNPCKEDHVVVVNSAHARAHERNPDPHLETKHKIVRDAFGDEVAVPDDVLVECSTEEVEKGVVAAKAYANRHDVVNISGLLIKALSEGWVVRSQTAPPAPSKGGARKKSASKRLSQHKVDLIKSLYIS